MTTAQRPIYTLRRLCAEVVLASLAVASSARAQESVPWGCDAPVGKTCYFSIFTRGGLRNFSLAGGRRTTVAGVIVGRDEYLVSIDAPNFGDLNRCRQIIAMGRQCQRKAVDSGYND